MAKPNYQYEKRQRELEKKKKKAEKADRKAHGPSDSPSDAMDQPSEDAKVAVSMAASSSRSWAVGCRWEGVDDVEVMVTFLGGAESGGRLWQRPRRRLCCRHCLLAGW